jgi:hypothetical protein
MIWAIGDVHGMFDALKRIMTEIRLVEDETGEAVEKIVFIGDYIDHGPSSKEVADLVRNPVYPTAALMGNHEDMALRMVRPDPEFLAHFGDMWMMNGGAETLMSIADRPGAEFRALRERLNTSAPSWLFAEPAAKYDIPRRYARFLSSLRYTHQESVRVHGRETSFVFMHALPNPALPVSDQLVGNHAAFNRHLAVLRAALPPPKAPDPAEPLLSCLDHSLIWGRDYGFDTGYGGSVIVHGHTPTPYYKRLYRQVPKPGLEPLWAQFASFPEADLAPFLFSRFPGARLSKVEPPERPPAALVADPDSRGWWDHGLHFAYETGGDLGVEAINIDTGAVLGGVLTALGLSERYLDEGYLVFLSCPSGGNRRQAQTKVFRRSVRISRLGGPSGPAAG